MKLRITHISFYKEKNITKMQFNPKENFENLKSSDFEIENTFNKTYEWFHIVKSDFG